MPIFDLPLEELKQYKPPRLEMPDFDAFWQDTLNETRQFTLDARFETADFFMQTVDTFDLSFNGFAGQQVKGWFILPRQRQQPLPCVVEYIGYGGGRSFPIRWLVYPSAGYACLVMDTRGQGSSWSPGDTPDSEPLTTNPHYPGFMTRGILDAKTYYYRRLISDAVRAVEAARSHPAVNPQQVAVAGISQGGGLALAVSGLLPDLAACLSEVPFLCHYRRASQITDRTPYAEIANYCKIHREKIDTVFNTLSYFDGLNFAVRSRAPSLFSVGLMDDTCPPSTVFAAYNYYAGKKKINIYEYNQHDGGGEYQTIENLKFLAEIFH